MNIYGFINVLKTLRFLNIKFGYLSESFISKIGKEPHLNGRKIVNNSLIFKVKAIPEHHI